MLDQRYQGMGFGTSSTSEAKWDASIAWYDLKPGIWNQIRIIGPIFIVAQNWFTTPKGKKFALFSRAWDPFTRSYANQSDDPIYQIFGNPFDSSDERIKGIAPRQTALVQAIIRPMTGVAQGGELKPMRIPSSVVNGIRKAMELNFIQQADGTMLMGEDGKPVIADPTDPDYGFDILIHYDPSKSGSDKYTVQSGAKSRLTDAERNMYHSLIDWATIVKTPSENQVKEALTKNGYMSLSSNTFGKVAEVGQSVVAPMAAPAPMTAVPTPMTAPMAPAAPMAAPQYQAQGFAAPVPPSPMAAAPAPMAAPMPMAPSPK